MKRLVGLEIENYGPLKHITMGTTAANSQEKELTAITAVIGKNDSGKSYFLDVFSFLQECLNTDVSIASYQNNRGGLAELVSRDSLGTLNFKLCCADTTSAAFTVYELSIGSNGNDRPTVIQETLYEETQAADSKIILMMLEKGKGFAIKDNVDPLDQPDMITNPKVGIELNSEQQLGVSLLGELKDYPKIVEFKNFLKNFGFCDPQLNSMQDIQLYSTQKYLDTYGSNINSIAYLLEKQDFNKYLNVLSCLKTVFPDIQSFKSTKEFNDQILMEFASENFTKPFYSQSVSGGILKLLYYLLVIFEIDTRPLICIKELENGLAHEAVANIIQFLRDVVGRTSRQFVITTHSSELVNLLTADEVWILEKQSDGFSIMTKPVKE